MRRLRQYECRPSLRKNSPGAPGATRPLPDLFGQHGTIGLMSGEAPRYDVEPGYGGGHTVLQRHLEHLGLQYVPTRGRYGAPERSVIVLNPSLEQMKDLGKKFGQESVVFSKGPEDHRIVYVNGAHAGKFQPYAGKHETFDTEPDNDYTYFPGHGFLRLHFDWNAAPVAFDTSATEAASSIPGPATSTVEAAGMDGVQPEHGPGDADDRAGAPDPDHEDHIKKSSYNKKAQIRARTSEQNTRIFGDYLRRLGFLPKASNQDRFGTGPGQRGLSYTPGRGSPAHELGHALMTPIGESLREHQQKLGSVSHGSQTSTMTPDQRIAEEGAAFKVQAMVQRRAGVKVTDDSAHRYFEEKPTRGPEEVEAARADARAALGDYELGIKTLDRKGNMVPGTSVNAQINTRAIPHPNNYQWHDGHTDHHSHGLKKDMRPAVQEHPHAAGPPQEQPHQNAQAAPVGVKTYAQFAAPYGRVVPGTKSNLLHYPYQGKAFEAKKLVADHGFKSYYAGGKYGRPDLGARNYNTKHLMVYDPSPDSGASFNDEGYTDAWRHMHELAHAVTYPALNSIYGEGRRIGKLGVHRSLRESQRAVHWEWLAAHKQRELSEQMGIRIPDEDFHRELNTVMHDAVHRAVTGQFTEPSDEGFIPHPHKVPLETALGMVTSEAQKLGLTDHNSLVTRKSEGEHTLSEKNITINEAKMALAKTLKEKLEVLKKDYLAMRQKELRKDEAPAVPAATPSLALKVTVPDLANCPKCGNPDAPGSCTCLLKGEGKTALFSGSENKGPKEPGLFSGAKKGAEPAKKDEPALFNGSENKGPKEPGLFNGAHKGAEPAKKGEKSPALFNGADKSGPKQPSLFARAKGGEDVFKDEPNMSLFSGAENKGDKEPELFNGAKKGASPLGKEEKSAGAKCGQCGKPMNPADAMVGGAGDGKKPTCGACARKNHASVVNKSESPLFKAMAAKNLCKTCMKSHQGPRCSGEPKPVKKDEKSPVEESSTPSGEEKHKDAVLPGDKKSKAIAAEGSGGKITANKTLKKDGPPMAKPPSGKNPTATPASKPGAQGVAQAAKPAVPATGAAPITKGDFGMTDSGKAMTLPKPAAPKKDASMIRGRPAGHIGVGRHALPGQHLFKKPAAAPAAAPAAPAAPSAATGTK
jgi:hypothetical protein